jgi:hypothetical protein
MSYNNWSQDQAQRVKILPSQSGTAISGASPGSAYVGTLLPAVVSKRNLPPGAIDRGGVNFFPPEVIKRSGVGTIDPIPGLSDRMIARNEKQGINKIFKMQVGKTYGALNAVEGGRAASAGKVFSNMDAFKMGFKTLNSESKSAMALKTSMGIRSTSLIKHGLSGAGIGMAVGAIGSFSSMIAPEHIQSDGMVKSAFKGGIAGLAIGGAVKAMDASQLTRKLTTSDSWLSKLPQSSFGKRSMIAGAAGLLAVNSMLNVNLTRPSN